MNKGHGCGFMVFRFMLEMKFILSYLCLIADGFYEWIRFDFARVLLATSSLEVIKVTNRLLVDGVMVELKIMEE